jgi:hypothetical protein
MIGPTRGLNPLGHIIESLLDLVSALWSVWLTKEGPRGHPVSLVTIRECEVRPWTWAQANDLWVGHLACGSLGACSVHSSLYVINWG